MPSSPISNRAGATTMHVPDPAHRSGSTVTRMAVPTRAAHDLATRIGALAQGDGRPLFQQRRDGLRLLVSAADVSGTNVISCRIVRRQNSGSNMAMCPPRQRLMPPPNGSQWYGSGCRSQEPFRPELVGASYRSPRR